MATIKKVKKAQTGKIQGRGTSGDYYNIDTSGYAAGAKKFPAEVVRPRLIGKAKELSKEISRKKVDQALKKKMITDSPSGFKKGGSIKKKMQAGGVAGKSPKAPMVDPNGAYTKVQERTLGNMKKGGKVKKAKEGEMQPIKKGKPGSPSPKFQMEMQKFKYKQDMDRMKLDKQKKDEEATSLKGLQVGKAKNGKWIQKATASIKKRGTAGKCTPITKPGCTGRAKALAKTFKKMAKARKGK